MKHINTIIGFLILINLNAQTTIKPTMGLNYTYKILDNFSPFNVMYSHFFNLNGGARLNEHFVLDLSVGYGLSINNRQYQKITTLTNSVGFSYRALKVNKIFSPLLGIDFGYELTSNGRGKYFSLKEGGLVPYTYMDNKSSYNKMLFFGRFKTMLDVEYKNISIRTGLNFNISCFDLTDFNTGIRANQYYMNIGIESGMMYTFPMKKRLAKKQAKQAE